MLSGQTLQWCSLLWWCMRELTSSLVLDVYTLPFKILSWVHLKDGQWRVSLLSCSSMVRTIFEFNFMLFLRGVERIRICRNDLTPNYSSGVRVLSHLLVEVELCIGPEGKAKHGLCSHSARKQGLVSSFQFLPHSMLLTPQISIQISVFHVLWRSSNFIFVPSYLSCMTKNTHSCQHLLPCILWYHLLLLHNPTAYPTTVSHGFFEEHAVGYGNWR